MEQAKMTNTSSNPIGNPANALLLKAEIISDGETYHVMGSIEDCDPFLICTVYSIDTALHIAAMFRLGRDIKND
jgi:hypothetical protein